MITYGFRRDIHISRSLSLLSHLSHLSGQVFLQIEPIVQLSRRIFILFYSLKVKV